MFKRNVPKGKGKIMWVKIHVSKTEKKSANKINQEENKQVENNGKKEKRQRNTKKRMPKHRKGR